MSAGLAYAGVASARAQKEKPQSRAWTLRGTLLHKNIVRQFSSAVSDRHDEVGGFFFSPASVKLAQDLKAKRLVRSCLRNRPGLSWCLLCVWHPLLSVRIQECVRCIHRSCHLPRVLAACRLRVLLHWSVITQQSGIRRQIALVEVRCIEPVGPFLGSGDTAYCKM